MRFDWLERFGVRLAGISEVGDGDCGQPEERGKLLAGLRLDARDLACGRQVHGVAVGVVAGGDRGCCLAATDGLVTGEVGLPLGVFVADCVPVYLFDPGRRVVGLAHAGREGTRLGIAASAVRAMSEGFGSRAADICAVVGPSAGPCCYEVSEAMADQFRALGLPADGRRLDLWDSNVVQLIRAGVPRDRIEVAGVCTICGGRFFSYRQGAGGKRNLAVICL